MLLIEGIRLSGLNKLQKRFAIHLKSLPLVTHHSKTNSARKYSDIGNPEGNNQQIKSKFQGFEPVFISPHIKFLRVACRLKLYQTGIVTFAVPYSFYLLNTNQLLPNQVGLVSGLSFFSILLLGVVGEFFRKFVGILYLSKDKSKIIISHNTFFGGRNDVELNVENIIPISDSPEDMKELVWKLQLYTGNPKSYYLCTRFGGILSSTKFSEIFGEELK